YSGSVLVGCSSNTIEGNLISNSTSGRGIIIAGGAFGVNTSASGNDVQGNYIGTNAAGDALLGGGDGAIAFDTVVWLVGNVIDNTIVGNVITGGVYLNPGGMPATGNVVEGNYIGTKAAGTDAVDPCAIDKGIVGIENSANNTTISDNLIAGCYT